MSALCPICGRPPLADEYTPNTEECYSFMLSRHGLTNERALTGCVRAAKNREIEIRRLEAELADTKEKLVAAQRALHRHHRKHTEPQNDQVDMFPDNARIT